MNDPYQDFCPLCGASLKDSGSGGKYCTECSYSFTEEDGVFIFDFRDLDFRMEHDERFKDAMLKIENEAFSTTKDVLSNFLETPFRMRSGELGEFSLEEPPDLLKEEGMVFASFSRLKGRIAGTMLVILTPESVNMIVDRALGQEAGTTKEIGEMEKSVIIEVGTLLTSNVCNMFAKDFDTTVDMTPPYLIIDMSSAIFNYIFSEFSQVEENVDFYKLGLESNDGVNVSMIFFPHPSTKQIFRSTLKDADQ
ncbi:MAG: chemotaxis protein CheC [Candidatus Thermoplasmatota archaeon]|nr:chemotaxis protein CheC [Candidatus Thermoplasmatota archaeon]